MNNLMLSLFCLMLVAAVLAKDTLNHKLDKKWTKPLGVGDKVPDVIFATRTRIDEDVENPFDWKSKKRITVCVEMSNLLFFIS